MSNRLMKLCSACGSHRLFTDASAEWDYATQQWVLRSYDDDNVWCCDCDCETEIVDTEVVLVRDEPNAVSTQD